MKWTLAPWMLVCVLASGCEQLGIDTPAAAAAKREADSKAIGGACRHAGRAIEDCYTLYKKADKSAIYAGWREMDNYMRENKIEPVTPVVPLPKPPEPASAPKPAPKASAADEADEEEAPPAKGKKGH
ncbi:hypothetical protein [Aquabacterium sp. OR-4]|uniref:hypothetical protein n=1 Tax=Aquabacterium sp. OR-4 TaxID=2978127 RepID=UPI0021B37CC0|nr:hypothetical protein [Aquabacterium sp. OR-4]MDT7837438.1 hypothetical protein [Aquabacterium sp. OR-4]